MWIPRGALKGECGRFPLFDLASGERLFENLSENRIRVARERLRALLMTDLEVRVSYTLYTPLEEGDFADLRVS